MDCYGIKTEGELFSGHYTSLRNRISDKDNDDMSFYNTSNAIEQRLFVIFGKFRKQFFETSLSGKSQNFEDVTTLDNKKPRGGAKEIFRRICTDPSEELQKLACAYYKIAYVHDSKNKKLLSFPWLAWDVINIVRKTNSVNHLSLDAQFSFDPLSEKITQHIKEYIANRTKPFNYFLERIYFLKKLPNNEREAWEVIGDYCKRHKGLDQLIFFCIKWAKTSNILNGQINELHICLLLIQFGLNHLPCELVETIPSWLEMPNPAKGDKIVVDLEQQHGGLGKKFMIFLEFLASRQFEILTSLNFMEPLLKYPSVFYQKQWLPIHKAALIAFHQIAFTFRFDALPATSDQRKNFLDYAPVRQVKEATPFVIEVPASYKTSVIANKDLLDNLCQRSECAQIVFRPLPAFQGYTVRFYVSAMGTMDAINELRSILSVRPNLNLSNHCREMSSLMAAAVYEKLTSEQ